MTLLDRQIAFQAEIAAPDDAGPASSIGMQIYRDAYRGRLLAALEASFERTRDWVGAQTFAAAAAHHVLTCPPCGWTLDTYGAGFPATLQSLFAADPEVAELAWLEWHLQQAFAAPDRPRLDPAELAAAGYSEAEWERMQFSMAAGFALCPVTTACAALWTALTASPAAVPPLATGLDAGLVVWRSGCSPHYRQVDRAERQALARVAAGATLGELAASGNAPELAGWLADWLGQGVLAGARLQDAD